MDNFCGSEFWNTEKVWYTSSPEFSICFMKTVLVWIPCAFLWIFTPVEISYLRNSLDRNVPWGFLNISKIILIILLILLSIIELTLPFIYGTENVLPMDYSASIVKISTYILSGIFLYFNKIRGQQTSGFLFLFWLLFGIFAIPEMLSVILHQKYEKNIIWNNFNFYNSIITYVLIWLIIILNCFADKEPIELKYPRTEKTSPEMNSSFLSKICYTWYDPIIWMGYKKTLDFDNLWALSPIYMCKEVYINFLTIWNRAVEVVEAKATKPKSKSKHCLQGVSVYSVLWKCHQIQLISAILIRIAYELLVLSSPIVLQLMLQYIAVEDNEQRPLWKGLFLTFLLFASSLIQTIINESYFFIILKVNVKIRSQLIRAIYQKVLNLSNLERQKSSTGGITSLISVDAQRITDTLHFMINILVSIVSFGIGIYLLWNVLGVSVFAGFAVFILLIPFNVILGKKMKSMEMKQMKIKDSRLGLINNVLQAMKILKLQAWEPSFEKKINDIRTHEMKYLRKVTYLEGCIMAMLPILPPLITLVAFGTYVLIDDRNILDAEKIFVSMSLFNIIRDKFFQIPISFYRIVQAKVSLERITKFLNKKELNTENVAHDPAVKETLIIENGNFSWEEDKPFLKDINLKVEKGELVAIVGVIGAGKSSLISALLGEMVKLSGKVNTIGNIGYVSQQSWIQNCTLRDNILFGKEMNRKLYEQVVKACALELDIKILPAGDLTEIGEKGINLSGGQKQRIALARSIYNGPDIYLFDDPLSAVDAHVGKHIFENVIGPNGLLAGKTRVLVTHGLSFLPQVDRIVTLKNGIISECGCYEELLDARGAFAEFINQFSHESSENGEKFSNFENDFRQRKVSSVNNSKRKSSAKVELEKNIEIEDHLIEVETSAHGNIKWETFKFYFKNFGIAIIVCVFLSNLIGKSFAIGSNYWLILWSSDPNANTDSGVRDKYLGIFALLNFLQAPPAILFFLIIRFGGLRASAKIHKSSLAAIIRAPLTFFDVTPIGRILQRFATDVEMIDRNLVQSLSDFLLLVYEALVILILITMSTYEFGFALIGLTIVYYFIQRFYTATARQLRRLESVSRSPIFTFLGETLQGVQIIRAYNEQKRFIAEIEERTDFNQKCVFARSVSFRWLGIRLQLISTLIVLFSSIFAVLNRDTIGAGWAGLSITNALQITSFLNYLLRMSSEFEMNLVAVERIKEYSKVEPEAPWKNDSKILPKNWPEIGMIELKDLKFRYRPGLELVLKGLSIKINGGEKVGVVGRTGAGKSSLSLALFRIIEADNGTIMIDGEDISKLGLHTLRSKMTIIPQDPVLFTGTLRMNLDPFNVKSDDELWTVLEQVNLKDFVQSLKAGLDYEIFDEVENLSVGQKQLFCLARALLRNSKIIILDEATAAVDLETDELIQNTIRSSFATCTILTIAHRLNTIMDSNRVLVLDNGNVAEFTSPKELLDDPKSLFYSLAKEAGLI